MAERKANKTELAREFSAVHDTIKKSTKILLEYEEKLKLLEKEKCKQELLSRIESLSLKEIKEEIEKIQEVNYGV